MEESSKKDLKLTSRQIPPPEKRELARYLRKHMTPEEQIIWQAVRSNRLAGLHFRRQQIIYGFLADFYCARAQVVIEIDGGIHDLQVDYDEAREQIFKNLGLTVVRVKNEEIQRDLASVLEKIAKACGKVT